MRHAYIGQVRNGKLFLSEPRRKQMAAHVAKMREGSVVEIELRKLPRRSNQQNGYYWPVVVDMVRERLVELGNEVDADQTHYELKRMFNSKPLVGEGGEQIGAVGETTTQMSKSEFSDYIARIQEWAASFLGISIPDPNEQTELSFT